MVQDCVRTRLIYFFSSHTVAMFLAIIKHWQLLIVGNEIKVKTGLFSEVVQSSFQAIALYVAHTQKCINCQSWALPSD